MNLVATSVSETLFDRRIVHQLHDTCQSAGHDGLDCDRRRPGVGLGTAEVPPGSSNAILDRSNQSATAILRLVMEAVATAASAREQSEAGNNQ